MCFISVVFSRLSKLFDTVRSSGTPEGIRALKNNLTERLRKQGLSNVHGSIVSVFNVFC